MTDFTPVMLEEEAPPAHAVHCQNCELCSHRQRVIWGEGNPDAPIIVLLDNPGLREDREGNPFVCGTRETLQRGMRDAGLALEMVYVTFLLKCRPKRAYNKPLARAACSAYLQEQLGDKEPAIILGLGNTVVQSLFPDEEADVKSFRGAWHSYQGIPVTFSYHPLAVRRRPVLMKYFVEDIKLVVSTIKEEK